MKTTKRSIELTLEKKEKFLHCRRTIIYSRCSGCGYIVKMLSPEDSAKLTGVTPRVIYRLIEANQIHFIETANGLLLVCLDSLLQKL